MQMHYAPAATMPTHGSPAAGRSALDRAGSRVCRFTAAHSALWNMGFMDGSHRPPERAQLWWRRFRDFRLAETANLYVFDNPSLCFGACCARLRLGRARRATRRRRSRDQKASWQLVRPVGPRG